MGGISPIEIIVKYYLNRDMIIGNDTVERTLNQEPVTWAQTIRVFIVKEEYFAFIYIILILAFTLSFNDTKREILVNPSIYDEGWCHWWRCTNYKKHLKEMGYLAWRSHLHSDNCLQIFCRLSQINLLYSKGCWIQGARFKRQYLGELQEAHKHLVRIRMDKGLLYEATLFLWQFHKEAGQPTSRSCCGPGTLWQQKPGIPRELF